MNRRVRGSVYKTVLGLIAVVATIMGLTFNKYLNRPSMSEDELQQMGVVVFEQSRRFDMKGMQTHNGTPFTHDNFKDKWTIAYFGYTFCPDICPTTLTQLNQMDKHLKQSDSHLATKMQYIMVTVDPHRDSREKLKSYVPHFNPDFIGITGSQKNTHTMTVQLNIPYTPMIDPEDEFYLVDHSANLVIVNPEGRYHGFIRPPLDADKLVRVMKAVDELY